MSNEDKQKAPAWKAKSSDEPNLKIYIGENQCKKSYCKNCKFCRDEQCINANNCLKGSGFERRNNIEPR